MAGRLTGDGWTITHVATGLAIADNVPSDLVGDIVKNLVLLDWDFSHRSQVSRKTIVSAIAHHSKELPGISMDITDIFRTFESLVKRGLFYVAECRRNGARVSTNLENTICPNCEATVEPDIEHLCGNRRRQPGHVERQSMFQPGKSPAPRARGKSQAQIDSPEKRQKQEA